MLGHFRGIHDRFGVSAVGDVGRGPGDRDDGATKEVALLRFLEIHTLFELLGKRLLAVFFRFAHIGISTFIEMICSVREIGLEPRILPDWIPLRRSSFPGRKRGNEVDGWPRAAGALTTN